MDMESESKEFLWCAKLGASATSNQWEGRDDGVLEQLVLKRACLGKGAKNGERNLVEVTSFNHAQEKVEACICCLRGGAQEDVNLGDLTIFPPAIFKLLEGSGPVHLVGNHMLLDDSGGFSDEDQEDFSEEDISEGDLSDAENEKSVKIKEVKGGAQKALKAATKAEAKPKKVEKKPVKSEEDEDEDDDDDEDISDLDEEMDEDDEMDDDVDEDEEEEEEPQVEVKKNPAKKRKLANGETKAGDENKKPDNTPAQKKKKAKTEPATPKTPLQQKENKTPQSAKKTPAKVYETVDEVKAAIKKYPGGKPRKEDKFGNWVKSAFKVKDDEWIKELWKAHKKDLGI